MHNEIKLKKEDFSLKEGNTPIIKSVRIPFYLKSDIQLYFKNESYNPTGSYTDRGIYSIFEKFVERMPEGILAYSSTGETGFSIAVYSSRLGINSYIFVSKDDFKKQNFSKILLYDSKVIVVDGKKEDIVKILEKIEDIYPLIFVNPEKDLSFVKGQEMIVKEIKESIGNIDYGFIGIEDGEEQSYYFFKNIFEKNGILLGGTTTNKDFARAHDLIFVENYQIEEAYNLMMKHEGIITDKRSAIGLAGIIKWDRINGFEKNEKIVQIIDRIEFKESKDFTIKGKNIIESKMNYEDILNILKLKKIEVK